MTTDLFRESFGVSCPQLLRAAMRAWRRRPRVAFKPRSC